MTTQIKQSPFCRVHSPSAEKLRAQRWLTVGAATLCSIATGCGAESGVDEPLGEVHQEFSASACAWVAADQVFMNEIDPTFASPTGYNTCTGGYVVDLREVSPDVSSIYTYLTGPTIQEVCGHTKLRTILYRQEFVSGSSSNSSSSGGGGSFVWTPIDDRTKTGAWVLGTCFLAMKFEDVDAGASYRMAVVAGDPYRPARSVSFMTDD